MVSMGVARPMDHPSQSFHRAAADHAGYHLDDWRGRFEFGVNVFPSFLCVLCAAAEPGVLSRGLGENSSTALVLWADRLSRTMWICLAHRAFFTNSPKKTINSALVCRFACLLPCRSSHPGRRRATESRDGNTRNEIHRGSNRSGTVGNCEHGKETNQA
jgi:hypothetical protein